MNSKLCVRLASILMFLHTIGHTFGALSWKNAPNNTIRQVIIAMQANHFNFMGRSATLANFYEGYGIMMIFVLLLVSIILWLLSNDAENSLAKRLLPLLAVFLLLLAVTEYVYFFLFAALFSLSAGIFTLLGRFYKK
jgi:hypothetical protein